MSLPAQSRTDAPIASTWTPLRNGVFRALWVAVLVSNVGTWMQTVGAQWLLLQQPNAPLLVALVQTADTLPDLLFSLVGGVLADLFDRRRLLIVVQGCLCIVALGLTLLTLAGQMTPVLLLIFTFILGAGSAFTVPAYGALVPDIVPRSQLPSASALSSISINLARAIGPAIAGLVIAQAGVVVVFAFTTATFLVFELVVVLWRPGTEALAPPRFPERFASALRAGGRYVRYSPVVLSIMLRVALFLVPATALWALLPIVASQQLNMGAEGYGLLLGALGVGAIAGALILPKVRSRLSDNSMFVAASVVYAVALAALVLVRSPVPILIVLLPAGMAWVAVLSSANAALQLFLPSWVRARGLSIFQMVLFGSQAGGAVLWGLLAGPLGVVVTLLVAAAVMVAGAATVVLWPLRDTRGMDTGHVVYWDEPRLVLEPDGDRGPVVVTTTYMVATENEQRFLQAMDGVRQSRLRTGAVQWGLFRDGEVAHRFVELFVVLSWEEHLRQHRERLTGTDQQFQEEANALSETPPEVSHLIATDAD